MNLLADDESEVLRVVRCVPAELQDEAFKYVADRLRPIRQPTIVDVRQICGEVLHRYAGRG